MNRRDEIYYYIKEFILTNGYSPTQKEIADHCGISSKSTISYHLDNLEMKGKIIWHKGKHRGLMLPD